MSFLTGKASTSTSSSKNLAYPFIQSQFSGQVDTGNHANNFLSALLGLGGEQRGAQAGYQNYLDQSGFNNVLRNSSRGVTAGGAAAGLLNSGSTARALQSNAASLGQNYFANYLQQLGGLNSTGLNAGQLIGGAGSSSTGTGTGGTQGLLSSLGSLGQGIGGFATLSDRRSKENIEKIGEFDDGLNIYQFTYKGSPFKQTGVMADEVEKLRPWALGPVISGYQTVVYGAL